MDNLGNEVIIKVKEAIRAKLIEMKANSSDEIIDYIMLLVSTKKSSSELTKSIDFVMEDNTNHFVKWLSTIIKKLQQVTVSTVEKNLSEKKSISEEDHSGNILNCGNDDVKLNVSDEEKEELMLNLSVNEENIQISDGEKDHISHKLNVSKLEKYDQNKLLLSIDKLNDIKLKKSTKDIKTKSNTHIMNITEKLFHEMKNTNVINDSKGNLNSSLVVSKMSISGSDNHEEIDSKRKRPRISINSDDEDQKNVEVKFPVTTNKAHKQKTRESPKKNKRVVMSQVTVVKPIELQKDINETKKKLYMHDIIAQRVDHQRGALALDTSFKYIQQQIGASNEEIAVIKKWRDYAVEMLRSCKKV